MHINFKLLEAGREAAREWSLSSLSFYPSRLHINYGVGGLIDISALLGEAGSRDLGEEEEGRRGGGVESSLSNYLH